MKLNIKPEDAILSNTNKVGTSKKLKPVYDFKVGNLPELLKKIECETEPKAFKEAVLRSTQLYFDGIIEEKDRFLNIYTWKRQSEALNALLRGMKTTVVSYYNNNKEIPLDEVREAILPYASWLVKYGSEWKCKSRHLEGRESHVRKYAAKIASALEGEKVDLIIPVASGGFEPAALAADCLGMDQLLPIRYSRVSKLDSRVLVPKQAPNNHARQNIQEKNILLVDDIVASGNTISRVIGWAARYSPAKIYFAVVDLYPTEKLASLGLNKHKRSRYLYLHKEITQE